MSSATGDDAPAGDPPPATSVGDSASEDLLWSEDEVPESGLVPVTKKRPHIDAVRRSLALWIVIPLVGLYCFVIIGSFLIGQDPTTLVAALAGLSSLAAAVIGFYFGQTSQRDSGQG